MFLSAPSPAELRAQSDTAGLTQRMEATGKEHCISTGQLLNFLAVKCKALTA